MYKKNISFQIMKYVRPIWYFHLDSEKILNSAWINYKNLSDQQKKKYHL